MKGTVLFYSRAKSWGFIAPLPGEPNSEVDYFVHRTGLINRKFLRADEEVEFEVSERNGKTLAVSVCVLEPATPATGSAR
jgi:cold shock CspA family protein